MPCQFYYSICVVLYLLVQALLAGQGHALFHFTHREMPATNAFSLRGGFINHPLLLTEREQLLG